jgi:starch phosphorylase
MRDAGRSDVARAAADLAARLPAVLAPFASIALNYRWSWTPGGRELFAAIDEHRRAGWREPGAAAARRQIADLARAARDPELVARAAGHRRELEAHLAQPARPCGSTSQERPIAFLCLEYGIHGSLPIYAGGLGGLAGDLLKEASDQALPLVAVGLLYRRARSTSAWIAAGGTRLEQGGSEASMALVTNGKGRPLLIEVPLRGRDVTVRSGASRSGGYPCSARRGSAETHPGSLDGSRLCDGDDGSAGSERCSASEAGAACAGLDPASGT